MCSMSDLMQYHSLSSKDTVFWKFLYNQVLKVKFCSTQKIGWDFSLAHYEGDKILLNWYWLWNMSCLLRLPTTLPPNFKALFSSRNTLCALNDAIVLLAGRKTPIASTRMEARARWSEPRREHATYYRRPCIPEFYSAATATVTRSAS